MKERFTNVAQKTLDVFVKFASTKAITALKDGFVLSMPITLVGSIFLLIANLPITGYTDFMARIFGSDWNLGLNQINNSTFNVLAMVIAVGIGYSYARNEKMDGISCGILTLVSFLIVSPSTLTVTSDTIKALGGDTATISNVLPNTWMGGNGIISAIIMGLIGSWVYTTCIKKNLRIKMPDAVPEGVSNAFSAMIPGFFIMCYSAIIYQVCQVFGGVSLTELIFKIIQTPMQGLTDNWAGMPTNQNQRNLIAKMKLIPVRALIKDKKLLLIDDSIVRGTQLRETTEFLYRSGAKEVHVRPACPPIMYGCKY